MPDSGGAGFSLSDIAARLGGDVLGDAATRVFAVAPLASAGAGQIAFLSQARYGRQLAATQASALILPPDFAQASALPRIVTANPYAYYAQVAALLHPAKFPPPGIHPLADCASAVPPSVFVGPHVHVGENVALGEGVVLHAGCVVGDGAQIGEGSVLHPHVTVYAGCRIGKNAIIHAGAVIGADGFGFAPDHGRWVKIPQIGRVVIGDDVEIGANTSIDRGALDDTVIGDGCKLDNQIQIGHNCVIGDHTVIAGCVGIAGSARIGRNCLLGGAAMILGHLEIADGTTVSPGSMVMKSIAKPGKYTALFPLESHDRWLRTAAQVRQLSRLAERVAELEKQIEKSLEKSNVIG